MGKHLVKDETGVWRDALPYIRTAAGWARVKIGYRKTSPTVWTQFFVLDLTIPAVPVVTSITRDGARLKITITAPASTDVKSLRVKVGKRIATNLEVDSDYITTADANDPAWSEWQVTPNQVRTKYYPVAGTLTNGATYYVTAWAQDASRNFSPPAVASFKYTEPVVPVPVKKTAYVTTVDTTTFRRVQNTYYRADKLMRLGSVNELVGLAYYSNKIAATLKNAKRLTLVKIGLQRTNTDYVGAGQFRLLAHTQTGYSAVDIDTGGRVVFSDPVWHTLNRGQSASVVIPEAWYPAILAGKVKGFGLYSQVSTGIDTIDPYAVTFHGFGTTSGRVYLEYEE
jgi:hypothetical protein